MALTNHIKAKRKDTKSEEVQIVYFTEQEWQDHIAAKTAADAAEAARDHKQEELNRLTPREIAFYKLYAADTGRTIPELKAAVKAHL